MGFAAALSKPVRQSQLFDIIVNALGAASRAETVVASTVRATRGASGDADLGLRVLLAEDNLINQKVASRMLSRWGCEVVAVVDGAAAIEAVRAGRLDLVLMDCYMPGLDGYEATRAIRALNGPEARIPIIAMTANALEGDRERCLDAGMDDYISKPVRPDDLLEVIHRQSITHRVAA